MVLAFSFSHKMSYIESRSHILLAARRDRRGKKIGMEHKEKRKICRAMKEGVWILGVSRMELFRKSGLTTW